MNRKNKPLKDIKIIHASWLFVAVSLGVIIGAVSSLSYSNMIGSEWLIVGVCLAIVAIINKKRKAVFIALMAGIVLGLWRGGNELSNQAPLARYIGSSEVLITGKVSEDPTYNTEGDLRVKLVDVVVDDIGVSGSVWVSTSNKISIKRSDIVSVGGELSDGFGSITAALYRADIKRVIRQDYSDVARDTRDTFSDGIKQGVREPEASLGAGFLLGQQSNLPEKLDKELRLLGLTHIVVASGYNLSILVRYARRLFEKVSRFTAFSTAGFLIYGFANITGFSPSMTRASLITTLSLGAWYYGRRFHPVVLLAVSAATTVLVNPTYVWGDVGWLLSFTAFIGVIILSPLLRAYFWGDDKPGNIKQVFIETLSAQILTMPIVVLVFGQYSPLALVANILILPLIPVAMLLTFIAGIGGLLLPGVSGLIGWPAETLMGYMTVVVDWLASKPIAANEVSISLTVAIVMYMIIFVSVIFLWRRTKKSFRNYNVIE